METKHQSGEWVGEFVQVRLRKIPHPVIFGKPYDSIATVIIVNGVAYVEGVLNKGPKLTRKDYAHILKVVKSAVGNKDVKYHRYIEDEAREVEMA